MGYDTQALKEFIIKAGDATYAGGGKALETAERPGFTELVYEAGDFSYRDSYAGHSRSRGMEVIRYRDTPVWASLYGGGMTAGNEASAHETFAFLKQALSAHEDGFDSLRGPHHFARDDWDYRYSQEGDIAEFKGHEEIHHGSKLVFFHEVIGGLINNN